MVVALFVAVTHILCRVAAVTVLFVSVTVLQTRFDELQDGVISYGPCQFPTLGFVVERYKRIQVYFFPSRLFFSPGFAARLACPGSVGRTNPAFGVKGIDGYSVSCVPTVSCARVAPS